MAAISVFATFAAHLAAATVPLGLAGSVPPATAVVAQAAPSTEVGTVQAKDIALEGAFGKLRISSLAATGSNLSALAIARLFDPIRAADLPEILSEARAASIRIPHLELTFGVATTELDDIELRGLDGGTVATFRIGAARIFYRKDARRPSISVGAITVRSFDWAAFETAAIGVLAPDTRGRICETLEVERVAHQDLRIGRIEAAQLDWRPFAIVPGTLLAHAGAKAPSAKIWLLIAADWVRSAAAARFDIKDVVYGYPDQGFGLKVAKLGLAQLGRGRLGRLFVEGFRGKVADALEWVIDEASLDDVDFSHGIAELERLTRSEAAPETADILALLPSYRARVSRLTLALFRDPSKRVPGPEMRVKVTRFQVDQRASDPGRPMQSEAGLSHLVIEFPPPSTRPSVERLRRLGYDKLDISARYDWAWDPGAGTVDLREVSVSEARTGSLTLHGRLAQATLPDLRPSRVRLESAELRFDDAGFVRRTLPSGNVGLAEIDHLRASVEQALGATARARQVSGVLAAFFKNPGSLTLRVQVPGGIGLQELFHLPGPAEVAERLDLRAIANERAPEPDRDR